MYKKIIKETDDDSTFKTLKYALKEIDISRSVSHPYVCQFLGYNMHQPIPGFLNKEDENENETTQKTTVALFMDLLPYNVKDVSKKGLNNTLKVRIAIETAFGMSHIHSLGMIHRDLKLENIMLNSIFDSKIIDFGLVHAEDFSETGSSLTRGIGMLAYMSPEMLNEETYDNKTDVYSYGIVLFSLFTGAFQSRTCETN